MENSFAVFTNTKHIPACDPVFLFGYVPKRKMYILQHKDMYKNVLSSSNHNREKLKIMQISIKRIVIYKIKSRQTSSRMRKVRIMIIGWYT